MDIVRSVTFGRVKKANFPRFSQGDTVGVHVKVKEGSKERIQIFKGVVIKIQGGGMGKSFTVRKISSGIGVERTFPFVSPAIDKVELHSRGRVRRSRLFFLRKLKGRAARLDTELVVEGSRSSKKASSSSEVVSSPSPKEEASKKVTSEASVEEPESIETGETP